MKNKTNLINEELNRIQQLMNINKKIIIENIDDLLKLLRSTSEFSSIFGTRADDLLKQVDNHGRFVYKNMDDFLNKLGYSEYDFVKKLESKPSVINSIYSKLSTSSVFGGKSVVSTDEVNLLGRMKKQIEEFVTQQYPDMSYVEAITGRFFDERDMELFLDALQQSDSLTLKDKIIISKLKQNPKDTLRRATGYTEKLTDKIDRRIGKDTGLGGAGLTKEQLDSIIKDSEDIFKDGNLARMSEEQMLEFVKNHPKFKKVGPVLIDNFWTEIKKLKEVDFSGLGTLLGGAATFVAKQYKLLLIMSAISYLTGMGFAEQINFVKELIQGKNSNKLKKYGNSTKEEPNTPASDDSGDGEEGYDPNRKYQDPGE